MDPEEEALQMHLLREYGPSSTGPLIIYKLLMDNLRANDFRAFKSLIEQGSKKQAIININYVYPTGSEETLLDVACKLGRTEFVEFLLEKGADPNRVNEMHNRTPLHFAVESGHVSTLKALLNESTINPNIEAGQQTALHMAVKKNDLECVELLLNRGASPNIPNSKGITALHLAASRSQRAMVNLIKERSRQSLDLDSYKDHHNRTTREILQTKLPDIVLPPVKAREVNIHDLRYYLNANDERNFLASLGKIDDEVLIDSIDELLKLATEHNFYESVIELLKRMHGNANGLAKAAYAAVQKGHPNILRELLKINGELANEIILPACEELSAPKKRGSGSTADRLECLKLILEQDNVEVRCTDEKGNTPLHYAARAGNREALSLLLERGSYIGQMNRFNVPPIADIPLNTLTRYFDDCLQAKKEGANEYTIEFNYTCLMPHNSKSFAGYNKRNSFAREERSSEMETLLYMAGNSALKHLLKHPLLTSFLNLKWHRIRHVLYLNFAYYVIFYLLLNIYILHTTYDVGTNENITHTNETEGNVTEKVIYTGQHYHNGLLWAVTAVAWLFLVVRESVQFISSPFHYISSFENWLEMIIIALSAAILCGAGPEFEAVAILLSAWELIVLIGQYPRMSTGIEMFKTVSWNFMRFLFLYAFLILAFAFAFFTLLKDGDDGNFPDPGHSLFKTIIMLTGEFDAKEISFVSHPVLSRLVFVMFVFLIAIVLFNLLNGLAVSDTAEILCKAELIGLISRIRLVSYLENIATATPLSRVCPCIFGLNYYKLNPLAFLARRILLFPNYLKEGILIVKPHDNVGTCCASKCLSCTDSNEKWSPLLTMDPDIIKQAKDIILNRDKVSDNERMFIELEKMKERLLLMESTLNTIKRTVENNNLNVRAENSIEN